MNTMRIKSIMNRIYIMELHKFECNEIQCYDDSNYKRAWYQITYVEDPK